MNSIGRSLDQDGFGARIHGNKGKSPKHALKLEDVKKVKQFLLRYANKYGLPIPDRLPNFRNEKKLFYCHLTKQKLRFIRIISSKLMRCPYEKCVYQSSEQYGLSNALMY